MNKSKSLHIIFILQECQPVFMNNIEIPKSSCVKYLGVFLDSKHNVWEYVIKKVMTGI